MIDEETKRRIVAAIVDETVNTEIYQMMVKFGYMVTDGEGFALSSRGWGLMMLMYVLGHADFYRTICEVMAVDVPEAAQAMKETADDYFGAFLLHSAMQKKRLESRG